MPHLPGAGKEFVSLVNLFCVVLCNNSINPVTYKLNGFDANLPSPAPLEFFKVLSQEAETHSSCSIILRGIFDMSIMRQ